jgi:hypothetical protein
MSKWTIRSRASVITSSIDIKVLMKEQLTPAINWCIEQNIDFEWEVIHGDGSTPDAYILSIRELIWANNLATLATILEQTDFNSDKV